MFLKLFNSCVFKVQLDVDVSIICLDAPGDKFGAALSVIGDINKDGYEDLAVGAPADLHPNSGRVYIYLGTEKGLTMSSQPAQVRTWFLLHRRVLTFPSSIFPRRATETHIFYEFMNFSIE